MLLFIILGITTGGFIPLQTSINSQLSQKVRTPFLSSLISFLVGTIFLLILSLSTGLGIPLLNGSLASLPWWGVLGRNNWNGLFNHQYFSIPNPR